MRFVTSCGDKLANAIEQGRDMIMNGVLAVSLTRAAAEDGWVAKDWDINGEKATHLRSASKKVGEALRGRRLLFKKPLPRAPSRRS